MANGTRLYRWGEKRPLSRVRRSLTWACAQIGYIILVVGGFGLFIMKAYPLIPNQYMAGYHKCVRLSATCCGCAGPLLTALAGPAE